MPVPAYMKIEGVTQGNITEGANSEESVGNIYQEEHADESWCKLSSTTSASRATRRAASPRARACITRW